MKTVKIAINGFGRIGRNVFKVLESRNDVDIVAINDLTAPATLAHLLKYDSVFGVFNGTVEAKEQSIVVNNRGVEIVNFGPCNWQRCHRNPHVSGND